ncbi:MAG: formylglycine-generating enzyme family protein [Rhodomicrobium sp.]
MAGKIFINYRRSLNLVEAQLLQKVLQRHFGKAGVFLDVSGLEGGQHWLHTLEGQVDASAAMVSLIAKGWTGLTDERGQRRLDNPDDFVRFEIARAFSRKIPVLPLRLNGADMPGVADLPLNLVQLAFQQAMHLRGETFDDDADKIAGRLKELIAPPSRKLPYWAAGAIAATALLAGLAAGPSVLTGLRIIDPITDPGLRAELEQSQKRAAAEEAARKEAEAKYAAAQRERDQAQAAASSAKERADRAEAALKRPVASASAEVSAPKSKPSFKDCSDCPEMVVVPAGSFTMGSPSSEEYHRADESPQHEVRISKPFAVGRSAVTFAEWDACAAGGGCGGYKPSDQGWGREDRPVINVSWDDAKAYVKWLSGKTRKEYRLLSEAEREYVTRAGTDTPFWWGNSISTDKANYDGTYGYRGGPMGEYRQKTLPVKSFQPNPWGLYQVHGNVWEWVEDCWHGDYDNAPDDGSAWKTGECGYRIFRGGSWNYDPQFLRAARRDDSLLRGPSYRSGNVGFRVAAG